MTDTRNIYIEFMAFVHGTGVRYAVLHGWEALLEGTVTDIDMVVAAEDVGRLETAIQNQYDVLNVLRYMATGVGIVLTPRGYTGPSLTVDLVTDYRWRGRILFTGDELLRDRRTWQGFWIVGLRQEFAYLIVKKVYEKAVVPPHQRHRLQSLASALDAAASAILKRLFGEFYGRQMLQWIIDGSWAVLESRVPQLRHQLRHELLKRDVSNGFRYWAAEPIRIWTRCRYPTGLWIAVVGPDSDATAALALALIRTFAGPFRGATVIPDSPDQLRRSPRGRRIPGLYSVGTSYDFRSSQIVQMFRFLFRIRPLLVQSTLVVMNGTDYQPIIRSAKRRRLPWRLLPRMIRRPELVFLLDGVDCHGLGNGLPIDSQCNRNVPSSVDSIGASKNVILLKCMSAAMATEMACRRVADYLGARALKRRSAWLSR